MHEFNYKLFIKKFLNNQLDQIADIDQDITFIDINNILSEIQNYQQDKFNLKDTINQLVIQCRDYFPLITLELNLSYLFNPVLILQSSFYIYKKFCYKHKHINILNKIFQIFYLLIDILNANCSLYRLNQLKYTIDNINNIQLTFNEIKLITIYLSYEYKWLLKNNYLYIPSIFSEALVYIYNYYNIKNIKIINFISRIFIFDINHDINLRKKHKSINKNRNYLYILNFLIKNKQYINDINKNIIKCNGIQWLNFLKKNRYEYINDIHIYYDKIIKF